MKTNDKTVTFRHYRKVMCLPNQKTEQELVDYLIEEELKRGYIPINVKYEKVKRLVSYKIEPEEYDMAYCASGYAGKKQARLLYPQIKGKDFSTIRIQ